MELRVREGVSHGDEGETTASCMGSSQHSTVVRQTVGGNFIDIENISLRKRTAWARVYTMTEVQTRVPGDGWWYNREILTLLSIPQTGKQ